MSEDATDITKNLEAQLERSRQLLDNFKKELIEQAVHHSQSEINQAVALLQERIEQCTQQSQLETERATIKARELIDESTQRQNSNIQVLEARMAKQEDSHRKDIQELQKALTTYRILSWILLIGLAATLFFVIMKMLAI